MLPEKYFMWLLSSIHDFFLSKNWILEGIRLDSEKGNIIVEQLINNWFQL